MNARKKKVARKLLCSSQYPILKHCFQYCSFCLDKGFKETVGEIRKKIKRNKTICTTKTQQNPRIVCLRSI